MTARNIIRKLWEIILVVFDLLVAILTFAALLPAVLAGILGRIVFAIVSAPSRLIDMIGSTLSRCRRDRRPPPPPPPTLQ